MKQPPSLKGLGKRLIATYKKEVITLDQQGNTVNSIYNMIQVSACSGTLPNVHTLVESIQRIRKYGFTTLAFSITRQQLYSLIWKLKSRMNQENSTELNKSLFLYSELKPIYKSIQLYLSNIEEKDYSKF